MVAHNVTVQDSSPLLIYSPGWVDSTNASADYAKYTGYAYPDWTSSHQTNDVAFFDFAFNGTAIYVYGTQNATGGPFDVVLIDVDASGAPTNTIDSAQGTSLTGTPTYQALLYERTGLKAGTPHNLHLVNGGQGRFALDYLIVQNDASSSVNSNATIDDANLAFTFGGSGWNESLSDPNPPNNIVTKYWNNGTEHTTLDLGATVKLDFNGTGVEIHGTWFVGNFSVAVDGQPYGIVVSHTNLTGLMYNRPRELMWFVDGLPAGNHTVEMTNLVWRTGNLTQGPFTIDYAVVYLADTANGTSTSGNATSSSVGAQHTGYGQSNAVLPYNAALFVLFMWIFTRVRPL